MVLRVSKVETHFAALVLALRSLNVSTRKSVRFLHHSNLGHPRVGKIGGCN